MALDSDHHDPQPPGLDSSSQRRLDSSRGVRLLAPTQTGSAHRTALAATTFLDEPTLNSLTDCCLAVHDIALMAPSHAVHQNHEDLLWQLAADAQALALWAHNALSAFRDARRDTSAGASAPPPFAARPTRLPSPPVTVPASSPAPDDSSARPKYSAATIAPARTEPRTSQHETRDVATAATTPPKHVVIRFLTSLRNQRRPHPSHVRDALNKALADKTHGGDWVSSIRYSRDDQLILHPHSSRTVAHLIDRRRTIDATLRPLLCPDDHCIIQFDSGGLWSKLVIHHAPLPIWDDDSTPQKRFTNLISELNHEGKYSRDSFRSARLLCPRDEGERRMRNSSRFSPQYASILLCIQDDDTAGRLLREGISVQGQHCRVSTYRPRRTTQP
ncbi:hypothetical protein EXIGLDRAFT_718425 [Exidia glandulosa HHB12029]|uniref:Uncharacterized protein n=1 Tax=Exidia glandulosa HHB12029 TaxID=1314781 RepID=A0A165HQY2_EXIGL|nr:hypothetical protein EXIGLDRAFT_718425 [Exidia glandulosa HHB12029]